jgi:molybdenum cofactor guanylyltransferase
MTFSAVLLAGGESRRMGRDKATIVFRGRPLWQWQLQKLRDLGPGEIFVSARTEPAWLPQATELILDEPPSRGPLSGLTRAMAWMQTSHLIALAVDMPFMTSEQMHSLCSLVTANCGVIPALDGRVEPLAAIYPREAAADFSAALAGNDFSLQKLVRNLARAGKVRIVHVLEEERNLYRSVNELADFKEERLPNRPPSGVGAAP